MEYCINGYQPEKLFHYFEEISAVPRGSRYEEKIADYLVAFAVSKQLHYTRDALHNVFMVKEATEGYEACPAVLLQGHTDMVWQTKPGVNHDFTKEGLSLEIDRGCLCADGTTLGADDGAAVALMLSILDDDTVSHPRLECLFTSGEEVGMVGALGFDYSQISASRLINIDSGDEGIATVGCAGGVDLTFSISPRYVALPQIGRPLSVTVSGLAGGHSGIDINRGLANADMILTELLSSLYEDHPFQIVSIRGGEQGNAIPSSAEAVIITSEPARATDFLVKYATDVVYPRLAKPDRRFRLRVDKAKGTWENALSFADTARVLALASVMPSGVIDVMPNSPADVQTSCNLGILRMASGTVSFLYHGRSCIDSKIDLLIRRARNIAKYLGFTLTEGGRYAGWLSCEDSSLVKDYLCAAEKVLPGTVKPKTESIHAGVECGIICSSVPGMEAISIGPNLYDIHTPAERLDLSSFSRLYEIVKIMLAYRHHPCR